MPLTWISNLFGSGHDDGSVSEDDRDRAISAYLALVRGRLRRGAFSGATTIAEKLNRKRFAKSKTQQLRRKINGKVKRFPPLAKSLLSARYKPNPVLAGFFPDRERVW